MLSAAQFVKGKLHENDRAEHHHTSDDLHSAHALILREKAHAPSKVASHCGNNGFQAHNQGGYRRVEILLTDDLKRVCHAARHDARVENRNQALRELFPRWMLDDQRDHTAGYRADEKLNTGEQHTVGFR